MIHPCLVSNYYAHTYISRYSPEKIKTSWPIIVQTNYLDMLCLEVANLLQKREYKRNKKIRILFLN